MEVTGRKACAIGSSNKIHINTQCLRKNSLPFINAQNHIERDTTICQILFPCFVYTPKVTIHGP